MASTDPEEEHYALVSNLPRQLDSHDLYNRAIDQSSRALNLARSHQPSISFTHLSVRDFLISRNFKSPLPSDHVMHEPVKNFRRSSVPGDVISQYASNLLRLSSLLGTDRIEAETNSQESRVLLWNVIEPNLMGVHDYSPHVKFEVLTRSKDDAFYRVFPHGEIRPQAERLFEIQMYSLRQRVQSWLPMLTRPVTDNPFDLRHRNNDATNAVAKDRRGSDKYYQMLRAIAEWALSTMCPEEAPFIEDHHPVLSTQPRQVMQGLGKAMHSILEDFGAEAEFSQRIEALYTAVVAQLDCTSESKYQFESRLRLPATRYAELLLRKGMRWSIDEHSLPTSSDTRQLKRRGPLRPEEILNARDVRFKHILHYRGFLGPEHTLNFRSQIWEWHDRAWLIPLSASLPVEVEILRDLLALDYLKRSSRPSATSNAPERQRALVPNGYHCKRTRLYQLSSREERRWKGCYLSSRGIRIRWKVIFAELQKPLAFTWWARSLNGRRYRFAVEYPANSSNVLTQRQNNSRSLSTTYMKEMDATASRNKNDEGRVLYVKLSFGDSRLPPMSYNSRCLAMDMDKRLRPIPASHYEMKKSNSAPESTLGIAADRSGRNTLSSGITNLRLEPLFTTHRSGLDRLRLLVESNLGHHVDWFPLPEIDRRPDSAKARLTWEYGGKTMSIYLNQHQVDRWQEGTDAVESGQSLPTFRDSRSTSSKTSLALGDCWQCFRRGLSKVPPGVWQWKAVSRNGTAKATACNMTASTRKDSYFCVDKLWNSVATTNMHTVTSIDSLEDDRQLFVALRETLNCAQGSWWHRLSSWRTCTGLQLSKFTFLFDNSDLVKVPKKAINPKVEDICKGYEYLIQNQQMGLDEHMQIMAEIILHGIQVPDRGKGSKAVLQGIPKLRTPPGILKKQLNSGCGFYAIQGYCLMKILFWVGVMLSPGLAFILVWLSVVGALDLQNAFVPITFLSGLIAIVLGISMVLGV